MKVRSGEVSIESSDDLSAEQRQVLANFEEWAGAFWDAAQSRDPSTAQETAMMSLAILARLFPNPNARAHLLLNSLVSLMAAAKSGRADHILMSKTGPIIGTKRGLGHSHVGGFAISAVRLLVDKEGYKPKSARRAVAKMLTEAGFSNRVGEHDVPKPVTEYAIRNWIEKFLNFPLMHETAAAMSGIHAINLERCGNISCLNLLGYLNKQAGEAVAINRIL